MKNTNFSIFECLDSYESKKRENLIKTKTDFENAVRCFELGGGNCKKAFEKILQEEKNDKVSKYYLEQLKQR